MQCIGLSNISIVTSTHLILALLNLNEINDNVNTVYFYKTKKRWFEQLLATPILTGTAYNVMPSLNYVLGE